MINLNNLTLHGTVEEFVEKEDGNYTKEYVAYTIKNFPTSLDVLEYMAKNPDQENLVSLLLSEVILKDEVYLQLKRDNSTLSQKPHFQKYKSTELFREYNMYAQRMFEKKELSEQEKEMLNGLEGEISKSPIEIKEGDIVFHGTNWETFSTWKKDGFCPCFISTSLSPQIAFWHSYNEAYNSQQKGVIIQFTAKSNQSVILCTSGKTAQEMEVLFSPNQQIKIIKQHDEIDFSFDGPEKKWDTKLIIVEAEIG